MGECDVVQREWFGSNESSSSSGNVMWSAGSLCTDVTSRTQHRTSKCHRFSVLLTWCV